MEDNACKEQYDDDAGCFGSRGYDNVFRCIALFRLISLFKDRSQLYAVQVRVNNVVFIRRAFRNFCPLDLGATWETPALALFDSEAGKWMERPTASTAVT